MSEQRTSATVPVDRRSAYPALPGVPWWAAVLIAVVVTAVGVTLDAGDNELGGVFGSLYALGCVLAVLAVRQSGIFTAIIQPPIVLFVTVPGAYFLFHGATFSDLKDTLISCAYPLVERFPLMIFTAAGVLLIGMTRWYFASAVRPQGSDGPTDETDAPAAVGLAGIASGFTATLKSMFGSKIRRAETDSTPAAQERPRRQRATHSRAGEGRTRSDRPVGSDTGRRASARSRHARPPVDEGQPPGRARRPRDEQLRSRTSRREPSSRDHLGRASGHGRRLDADEPRGYPPREPYPPYSPRERYQPYEPPPRRRPESSGGRYDSEFSRDPQGWTGSQHPVSRVRYRGERDPEPRGTRGDHDSWR